MWRAGLVPSVLDADRTRVVAFWNTRAATISASGKCAGRGYAAMRQMAPALADAVLRFCHTFYREHGEFQTAAQLADQTWRQSGCRDPYVTEAHILATAAGGRPADLVAALRDDRASRCASRRSERASLARLAHRRSGTTRSRRRAPRARHGSSELRPRHDSGQVGNVTTVVQVLPPSVVRATRAVGDPASTANPMVGVTNCADRSCATTASSTSTLAHVLPLSVEA